ncbi:hypothetical protein Pcinc_031016, partial [Petrolisthes cinctipes]
TLGYNATRLRHPPNLMHFWRAGEETLLLLVISAFGPSRRGENDPFKMPYDPRRDDPILPTTAYETPIRRENKETFDI